MSEKTNVNRVPEGVPTGGQFAASARAESGVTLDGATSETGAVTVEAFEVLWCEACEMGFDEAESARLYECENCQTKSTERRCETCKKFMARSEEPGCPRCEEAVSDEPVQVVHDHDGEIIRAEDFEPDGPTKAERDAAKKVADAAKAEADRIARREAKQANTATGTAVAIEPGAVLINPDDDSRFATEAEVLSVRHVETPDGPIVIFKAHDGYSPKTVVRRASDAVPVAAKVERYPTEKARRDGERITAADFGGARLVEDFQDNMRSVSSPSNGIDIQVGSSARDGGTLPALAMLVGRRGASGSLSGMVHYLARWDDPTVAAKALDEMDRAADVFETARAEHPPVVEDEDDVRERAEMPADWSAVAVREPDWIGGDEMETVTLEIGYSDWDRDKGALLKASGGGQNMTLDDPAVLRAAVAEARKHLSTLTGIPTRPDVVDDKI